MRVDCGRRLDRGVRRGCGVHRGCGSLRLHGAMAAAPLRGASLAYLEISHPLAGA